MFSVTNLLGDQAATSLCLFFEPFIISPRSPVSPHPRRAPGHAVPVVGAVGGPLDDVAVMHVHQGPRRPRGPPPMTPLREAGNATPRSVATGMPSKNAGKYSVMIGMEYGYHWGHINWDRLTTMRSGRHR